MNQTQLLSLLAMRRLHCCAVAPAIAWNAAEDSIEFGGDPAGLSGLEDRQGLGQSLRRAVERAWLTIELVLGREAITSRLGASGQRLLADLVRSRCFDSLAAIPGPFRQAMWRELHAAREAGPLVQGGVNVDQIYDQLTAIEPERVADSEWQSLFQLADDLGRSGYGGLKSLLQARLENGDSLLVSLVLSFLPFELETEGARISRWEQETIPAEQILWLIEQSEPLEEMLNEASHCPEAFAKRSFSEAAESPETAARVRQGLSYSQRGDYERAAVEFTAALHNGQARPQVYLYRGDAYRLRGDYDRAAADYDAALRLDPRNVLALVNRALVHRLLGRPESAVADFSEALRLDPNSVLALNGRGTAYADLGHFEKAVADHSQALRIDPHLAWAHQSRGDAYASLGAYDHAISDYTQALRLNPHLPLAFSNRGDAYRLKGDLDRSIADYTEALRLDPLNPRVYTNRGESYRRKRELDRALADFGEAIRVDPTNPAVYLSRGIAYQLAGDFDRAVADFDRAEQFDSANPAVFYQRALTYSKEGSYDRAMADLNKAIELNPRDAAAYLSRGSLRAIITNFDGAIGDFSDAIRLDPSSAQARLERGRVYAQTGEFTKAQEDCAVALKIDSNFVPAYVVRGGTLLRMGDYQQAISDFNEALRINPRYAKAFNDRGVAFSKLEQFDNAVADFSKALQYSPEYVQALANRANAWQLLKQPERALRDFTQAVRLDVKYASAYCTQRAIVEVNQRRYDQALADFTVALVIDPNNGAAHRGMLEAQRLRESDFDCVESEPAAQQAIPDKAPAPSQSIVAAESKSPSPTAQTTPARPRAGGAAETQLAISVVETGEEPGSASQSPSEEKPETETAVEDGFEVVDENQADATSAGPEYVANAAVEVEPEAPAKPESFPEKQQIEDRQRAEAVMAAEARRRFEENKLKAEKARKTGRVKEDPEMRAERVKRRKQYVMIGIGAICIAYWLVPLIISLLPKPVNPFKEMAADEFLGAYAKDKVAADNKFADHVIVIRGKVSVVADARKQSPPRIFFDANNGKEDMRIECQFHDPDVHWEVQDGQEYRIAGKVQRFKPGAGILLIDANFMIDPKKTKARTGSDWHLANSDLQNSSNRLAKHHSLNMLQRYNDANSKSTGRNNHLPALTIIAARLTPSVLCTRKEWS